MSVKVRRKKGDARRHRRGQHPRVHGHHAGVVDQLEQRAMELWLSGDLSLETLSRLAAPIFKGEMWRARRWARRCIRRRLGVVCEDLPLE